MSTLSRSRKTVAALPASAAVIAGSGFADAYWTTSGTGTGSASAAAAAQPVVAIQTSPIA